MNINEVLKSDYDLCCKELRKATKKLEKQDKEIKRLNNIINEVQNIIFNNAFKFDKWVENENGKCILSQSNYAIKDLSGNKVREIWDLLNKS